MTEVGMALSNKIDGERRPGAVGEPLPNVEIKLEDENGNEIKEVGEIGQILLKEIQKIFIQLLTIHGIQLMLTTIEHFYSLAAKIT